MLYRLRCPRCGTEEQHAFVRPGAVTVCGHCHTIYRVEPGYVQRVPSGPAAAVSGSDSEAKPDPPRRRSPGDTAMGEAGPDDTSIVGLSGLTEVMRGPDEADAEAGPPTPGRVAATGQPDDPPHPRQFRQQQAQAMAQRRATEAARRRNRRTLLVLLGAMTVMIGSLGVAVALIAARPPVLDAGAEANPMQPPLTPAAASSTGQPATSAASEPQLVVVARSLDLRDPQLLADRRPGLRGVVELLPADAPEQLEPDQVAIRVNATGLADASLAGPVVLLLTASDAGRLIAAWQLTDPRDVRPDRPRRVIARLGQFPEAADPQGWVVIPLDAATRVEP